MAMMRDRLCFQQRATPAPIDGLDQAAAWPSDPTDGYVAAAQVQYLRGTEAVQAARLQGDQPVVITLRSSAASGAIDNSYRAVDTRDPARVFDVTSAAPTDDRAYVQVLAVQRRGDPNG